MKLQGHTSGRKGRLSVATKVIKMEEQSEEMRKMKVAVYEPMKLMKKWGSDRFSRL